MNQSLATDGPPTGMSAMGWLARAMVNRGKINLGVAETLFMATPSG